MKNRAGVAIELLEKHGFVTNRMFKEIGLTHTGRNAVGEAKPYFKAKGFTIKFKGSRDFLENRWTLVPIQEVRVTTDQNGQMAFA